MILTIAMVVYNEEKRLPLLRGNLELFSQYREHVMTVIIDNASTDATATALKALQAEFDFQVLTRTENNMGAARADAVKFTFTPWLVFLDADCSIDAAWMDLTLKSVGTLPSSVVGFGGPWIPAGPNKSVYASLFQGFGGHFNMPQIRDDGMARPVRHIPTACVVYRTQALVAVGNFDPSIRRVGEDLDMSYRLLSRGGSLMLLPGLRFEHHLPDHVDTWFYKIFTYGEARLRIAVVHKDLLAMNYMLPILFFGFLVLNIAFVSSFKCGPLMVYFLVAAVMSAMNERSWKAVDVFFHMVATHVAYSVGMAWGAVGLTYEAISKRKQSVPISCTPKSVEEIL